MWEYPVLAKRSIINFVLSVNLLLVCIIIILLCYDCVVGLKRSDFDNKQVTFKEHVHREHNMWDYLHFFVLLEEKALTELTGPESYVKKLIMVCGSL